MGRNFGFVNFRLTISNSFRKLQSLPETFAEKTMKQITLVDIAKKAGVAPSTVSRALNDHPDVSEKTKKAIKEIAKENNFRLNPIAQGLKSNNTKTIGVIVPEIKHDFFASILSGIEEVTYNAGYSILLCQSNESYEREVINMDVLLHQRVAGVLASISQNTEKSDHFRKAMDRNIPLVFFDRVCEDLNTCKVVIDDEQSAFEAVTYLIEHGYKKISHFAGPKSLSICQKRLSGYSSALKKKGISYDEQLVCYGGLHEQDGYNAMENMNRLNNLPDAIFAVNDPVAIGAYQKIKELGLKIPDDVAIVGFSNNKIASLVDPPLTTVNQPSYEMGKKAAEILLTLIENKNISDCTPTILKANLVVRGST